MTGSTVPAARVPPLETGEKTGAERGRRGGSASQREPGQFLFSPWHLVLIPIAIAMLVPMVWMLATSLETLNETRHFPPIIAPHTTPTC